MIWANRVLPTHIDASDYKLAAMQAGRRNPIQVGDTHKMPCNQLSAYVYRPRYGALSGQ